MIYIAIVSLRLSRLSNKHQHLTLLLLTLPLLLLSNGHQSLLGHDEAYYAMQARWMLETHDWITPQWWGTPVYDRTVGIQWLIALAYHLFSISENSARLPSIISCTVSILLTYEIGKIILNQRVAWLGSIILCLMTIWISEGILATQNSALVCIELIGIWALLRAEELEIHNKKQKIFWGVLAGTTVGLGFMIKTFMILLPIVSITPYLIVRNRHHKHLSNLGIYIGLIIGAIPVVVWLTLSYLKYGLFPLQELFGKLLLLSSTNTWNPGPLYYFWSIPLNTFPWAIFTITGMICICLYSSKFANYSRRTLLLGYPLILFLMLTIFRTRTPYYPLQLLPFMALLASVAFNHFEEVYYSRKSELRWLISFLVYTFTSLGILLFILGILVNLNFDLIWLDNNQDIKKYGLLALILGSGWSTITLTWKSRKTLPYKYWLASWLISPWLTLASLGLMGAWTDRNPDFRTSIQQPMIAQVIKSHPINFVVETGLNNQSTTSKLEQNNYSDGEISKNLILLTFYTPHLGKSLKFEQLPANSYAWISPKIPTNLLNKYQKIGSVKGWKLIQSISTNS